MINSFGITVYGTNNNFGTSTVALTTIQGQTDIKSITFDAFAINLRNDYDIEMVTAGNGRKVKISNVGYESFKLDLLWQSFESQTVTPTFLADRFNSNVLKMKYHFLYFHNSIGIKDYKYLSNFLDEDTVLTHCLQVVFAGISEPTQAGALWKWTLEFEGAFPIT